MAAGAIWILFEARQQNEQKKEVVEKVRMDLAHTADAKRNESWTLLKYCISFITRNQKTGIDFDGLQWIFWYFQAGHFDVIVSY